MAYMSWDRKSTNHNVIQMQKPIKNKNTQSTNIETWRPSIYGSTESTGSVHERVNWWFMFAWDFGGRLGHDLRKVRRGF